ncbi:MAG TPA: hypothetical protein PLH80_07775 [Spirochaetota bacterium]|nr:hypothetical protein [Spirochaetota bacterium]HOT19982.1 hypothetical protein [Spirochaetota bacterium]HQG42909.1 hypothetical protein [Spirochaetota bacterium]HQI38444.1 hypothetical protein [Spirochaetota bacterium]HRR61310.1 hypothetical protein [Spirochaetota bacterium]
MTRKVNNNYSLWAIVTGNPWFSIKIFQLDKIFLLLTPMYYIGNI